MNVIQPQKQYVSTMPELFKRLSTIGLSKKYIKDFILPSWWDKSLEDDSNAIIEVGGYVAKRLGIEPLSLLSCDGEIQFRTQTKVNFKKRVNEVNDKKLKLAEVLASRVSELVSFSAQSEYRPLRLKVEEIRAKILENRSTVDIRGVLDFCWSAGIPVIHFSRLPKGAKTIDGMAGCFHKRPVILISSSKKSYAWLLFCILHELGHIILGHIDDGLIIDTSINSDDTEQEEKEANNFAINLIFGEKRINWIRKINDPNDLVEKSIKVQDEEHVYAGSVCLDYAYKMKDWPKGQAALNILEPNPDAPKLINSYLFERLNMQNLDSDSQEYLELMIEA